MASNWCIKMDESKCKQYSLQINKGIQKWNKFIRNTFYLQCKIYQVDQKIFNERDLIKY